MAAGELGCMADGPGGLQQRIEQIAHANRRNVKYTSVGCIRDVRPAMACAAAGFASPFQARGVRASALTDELHP